MDYADGGDLQTKIKMQKGKQSFTESQILDWFTQICLAIKHIHDRKILHRDLKSQNVFITKNGLIKLGDFGIAKCLKNTVDIAKTVVGTPYYFSPELIQNKPYSFKSDIWSLGILLYEMCALKMPFDGSNLAALSVRIVKGNYTPLPTSFTKDIRALISSMLHVDMNKRPGISEILRHNMVKPRIKNFLSESEYDKEFSNSSGFNEEPKIVRAKTNVEVKKENKPINMINLDVKATERKNSPPKKIVQVIEKKDPKAENYHYFPQPPESKEKIIQLVEKKDLKENYHYFPQPPESKEKEYIDLKFEEKVQPKQKELIQPSKKNSNNVKKKPEQNNNNVKKKESKAEVLKKERMSLQVQEEKKEEKEKPPRSAFQRNKLQANPNFEIKRPKGDEELNNDMKIEIYEPKKKFNPELYKIKTNKEEENNQNNAKIVNVVKETKHHKIDPSPNNNQMHSEYNTQQNPGGNKELKSFLKEMRQKKKQVKEENDDNIVIKVVEPRFTSFKQISSFTPQEELKNCEEEKKATVKIANIETTKTRYETEEQTHKNDSLQLNFTLKGGDNSVQNPKPNHFDDTDYSQLECYKIILETELGDSLFSSLYRIIDNNVDMDKTVYDHTLVHIIREELFELDEEKTEMCLKKVPDVFSLVIKERIALFNANK